MLLLLFCRMWAAGDSYFKKKKKKIGIQVEADMIDLLCSLAHAHLPRTIGGKHVLHSFLLIPGLWS